jgi:hypothetical protein
VSDDELMVTSWQLESLKWVGAVVHLRKGTGPIE